MQAIAWLALFERVAPAVISVYAGIEDAKKDDGDVDFKEGMHIFRTFLSTLALGAKNDE